MDKKQYTSFDPSAQVVFCRGDWILPNLEHIQKELKKLSPPATTALSFDLQAIQRLDSAGAWLIHHTLANWSAKGIQTKLTQLNKQAKDLLHLVDKETDLNAAIPKRKIPNMFAVLGKHTIEQLHEFFAYLSFIGRTSAEFLFVLFRPHRWRWNTLAHVIDTTGYQALMIIGLLSFMIGVVIAYQMGNQLRNYGANVFIVNLLGLSILREFGPLITSIMVAGRTGSAFTAQLGSMKINQEIDALNTMGVTPIELLLIPRIIGLVIVLPLLTMWADIFGVFGGMLMANAMLDISFYDFLHRFQHEIPLRSLIIGLGKAPVFALIIASIGCFQGMQVEGSAESVGKLTTRSVVLAIFFIIVADALFSIIFSKLNL